jgi:hypothetical protein
MFEFEIRPAEANRWWQKNTVLGVFLNRLMIVFILAPIGLVFSNLYTLSFIAFSCMIPYGFLLRHLAVRAVRNHLTVHPEALDEFENEGIISC